MICTRDVSSDYHMYEEVLTWLMLNGATNGILPFKGAFGANRIVNIMAQNKVMDEVSLWCSGVSLTANEVSFWLKVVD